MHLTSQPARAISKGGEVGYFLIAIIIILLVGAVLYMTGTILIPVILAIAFIFVVAFVALGAGGKNNSAFGAIAALAVLGFGGFGIHAYFASGTFLWGTPGAQEDWKDTQTYKKWKGSNASGRDHSSQKAVPKVKKVDPYSINYSKLREVVEDHYRKKGMMLRRDNNDFDTETMQVQRIHSGGFPHHDFFDIIVCLEKETDDIHEHRIVKWRFEIYRDKGYAMPKDAPGEFEMEFSKDNARKYCNVHLY